MFDVFLRFVAAMFSRDGMFMAMGAILSSFLMLHNPDYNAFFSSVSEFLKTLLFTLLGLN